MSARVAVEIGCSETAPGTNYARGRLVLLECVHGSTHMLSERVFDSKQLIDSVSYQGEMPGPDGMGLVPSSVRAITVTLVVAGTRPLTAGGCCDCGDLEA